jgi:hypothetical protein
MMFSGNRAGKILLVCALSATLLIGVRPGQANAEVILPITVEQDRSGAPSADDGTVEQQAARGGYRSPRGSFSGGGARTGVAPGEGATYRTGPRAPSSNVTRPPGTTTGGGFGFGRTGTFLGGMAAGAVLGHLFNPFAGFGWGWGTGYGGGFGFGWSFLSLLIWGVILYAAFRLIRRLFGGGRGGGGGWYR